MIDFILFDKRYSIEKQEGELRGKIMWEIDFAFKLEKEVVYYELIRLISWRIDSH